MINIRIFGAVMLLTAAALLAMAVAARVTPDALQALVRAVLLVSAIGNAAVGLFCLLCRRAD